MAHQLKITAILDKQEKPMQSVGVGVTKMIQERILLGSSWKMTYSEESLGSQVKAVCQKEGMINC